MTYRVKPLFAALFGLLLATPAAAGPVEELEGLAGAAPEEYGKTFDNEAVRAGSPADRGMTQQQLRQTMLADLDALRNIFEARYAPAGWKGELNGWSLDAEMQKARDAVNAMPSPSVKEYQKIVKRLFASTQDYHVSVSFHSTEMASLPIGITESGGRYYISGINRKALPESTFPYKVGDEVTVFDGKPTAEAVAGRMAAAGMNNVPGADRALAASLLRFRGGVLADTVPTGPVKLEIRPAGAAQAVPVQLDWAYTPELIAPQQFVNKGFRRALPMDWLSVMYAEPLAAYAGPVAAGYGMGDREGPLPDLGEIVWRAPSDSRYRAYIYRNPLNGRNTGYVRIPTYMVEDPDAMVRDFARIVAELERGSDGLVIDQLNNPGGIVFYLYALASMLTSSPLELPLHRITLTPADVAGAIEFIGESAQVKTEAEAKEFLGESLAGYPVTLELLKSMRDQFGAVVKQWNEGKTLTDPLPLFGLRTLQPAYGARYSKPIIILTNERDMSGGDFFPAIMQDNRRAGTFGARTGGAGGVVKQYKYQNSLLGMSEFGLTETIAYRPNGKPIESLGVTPDLPYEVQPGDLQNGFAAYAAAVNRAAAGFGR
ncbi:MAG: protease-like activity factor CPAF [Elusimicrobiales bacterium]